MDKKEALGNLHLPANPRYTNALEEMQSKRVSTRSNLLFYLLLLFNDPQNEVFQLVLDRMIRKWKVVLFSLLLFNFINGNLPLGMLQMSIPLPNFTRSCALLSLAPDQFNFDSQCPQVTKT